MLHPFKLAVLPLLGVWMCVVDVRTGHPQDLAIVLAAFESSKHGLKSGVGEGTFRQSTRANDSDWTVEMDATVKTEFSDGNYRVSLRFKPGTNSEKKRVIIFDGSGVFASRTSSTREPPHNCEVDVYGVTPLESGIASPQMVRFPWDVSKLPSTISDLNVLLDTISPQSLELTRSATKSGDILGEYSLADSGIRVVFRFPAKFGYNMSQKKVIGSNGENYGEINASWAKQNGIWYIDEMSEYFAWGDPGSEENTNHSLCEMKYTKFDVNSLVSSDRFTMAALGSSGGSRILDHRSGATQKVHYMPLPDEVTENKLGSMLDELDAYRTGASSDIAAIKSKSSRGVIVAVNIMGIVAICAVLAVWRRRTNSAV